MFPLPNLEGSTLRPSATDPQPGHTHTAMETNIFGRFSNLRRKNQPLTTLTELYSKIANESIYYNKLESTGNYKAALQGWKALTTDALFQLTMIEKNYPHTENYTVDELSLLSGVRELYHKAQKNLDSLQANLNNNPDWHHQNESSLSHVNNSYHTRDHKSRLQSISSSSTASLTSHGLARTTLRDNDHYASNGLSMRAHNYSLISNESKPVKVNFTNSKSIGSIDPSDSRLKRTSEPANPFVDFTDDVDTSSSNSDGEGTDRNNDSFSNVDTNNPSIYSDRNDKNNIQDNNDKFSGNNSLDLEGDDDDFDVSDIYQDSDEYENDFNESNHNYKQNNNNNGNYIQIDDEYLSRLNALNTLNGGNIIKDSKLGNNSTTSRLSSLSLDDSDDPNILTANYFMKGQNNNAKDNKEFIPSSSSQIPPPLPHLPPRPPIPVLKPRVPVIVQQSPKSSSPSSSSQHKPTINKKHNLLNKGDVSKESNTRPLMKNYNNEIKSNSFTSSLPPSQIHLRPKEKTTKVKAASTSTLPLNRTSLGSSERLPRQISPTQVAKLVYKNKSNNDSTDNSKLHKTTSNNTDSTPLKKKTVPKSTTSQRSSITKSATKSKSKTKLNSSTPQSRASPTPTVKKTKSATNNGTRTNTHIKKSLPKKQLSSTTSTNDSHISKPLKNPSIKKIVTDDNKRTKKRNDSDSGTQQSLQNNKSNDSLNNNKSNSPSISKDNDKEKDIDSDDEFLSTIPNIDKALGKQILQNIIVQGDEVHWDDIAGLNTAKNSLKEAVVYPFLRPDLFMGLREPVTGMLLFGPPGTGKTMLARAVACESHSTFFSISASSLTSKYLGESEKLVRALFTLAQKLSPSIIFVDEIDSILGSRNQDGENESSRRIKNEFLIQWSALSRAAAGKDNKNGKEEDKRVLVLAATNLPWSIDDAARRRFVRRQYIPLPEDETRKVQIQKLLSYQKHTLSDEDFEKLIQLTHGYSGSDITSLAKDAAMGPLRELGDQLLEIGRDNIRPIALKDFENSLQYIKPSVSSEGLKEYEDWAKQFGSSGS